MFGELGEKHADPELKARHCVDETLWKAGAGGSGEEETWGCKHQPFSCCSLLCSGKQNSQPF